MALTMMLIIALYGSFDIQYKHLNVQEQMADMQQSARTAMDRMTREIRMAGHNPLRVTTSPAIGILTAAANAIQFSLDITGGTAAGEADGNTTSLNENITYGLFTAGGSQRLGRKAASGGDYQTVADNVQSVQFVYYDHDGNILSAPVSAVSQIRRIKVNLTLRTAKEDPGFGCRTFTLESYVTPRNLGL
jgi:type IV pilus assembly protein PilW